MPRKKKKIDLLLEPISAEAYLEFLALIQNPPAGSAVAAAKEFGVDLYSTLENLKLTPAERIQRAAEESIFAEQLRQAGRHAGL